MNLLTAATSALQLFGTGRSPAMLLNLTAPHRGYRVRRDIPYGDGPRHRMDFYVPVSSGSAALPVLVFFYGGGFRAGRKSEYRFVGQALATRGMIVAVPDYRIYPAARFPDFLSDAAAAVVKTREIAASHGGDPAKLILAGHSAGAYLAVMLAANPQYLAEAGGDRSSIKGVIALSGRYHQSPLHDDVAETIFCGPARNETRPANFIRGRSVPMLLAAGSREDSVVLEEAHLLADHLRAQGSPVTEINYPGIRHAGIVAALAPGFRGRAPVRDDMAAFVQAQCA
jgi:acetyl esterase/lipase